MHHLFLSPHYDDVVYSCGGTIAKLNQIGEPVTVVTICAGYPPTDEISYFAQTLHERWGAEDNDALASMIDTRRGEDQAALELVGATGMYLEVPDCIYRRGGERNRWLYPQEESIFGRLRGEEDELISNIARSLIELADHLSSNPNQITIYAPLTIGNHVDHQLVRYAAERAFGAETLVYYQDFPYALDPGQTVTYQNSIDWESTITYLSEEAIALKVEAVAAYRSQISTFWKNTAEMEKEVRDFVRRWGNGELFWRYTPRL